MEQIIVTRKDGSTYPLAVKREATAIREARQSWGLLGDDVVNITVESPYPQHYEIGDYFNVFGRTYKLNQLPKVRKEGAHKYTYELTFEGVQYDLLRAFYDVTIETTSNTLQDLQGDALTGNLHRFATVLVSNANRVFPGKWQLGACPDTIADKTLTFGDGDNCLAVLQNLCRTFEVEAEITQQDGVYTISLHKRVGTTHPYVFELGKGKGLYALDRQNVDSSNIVTRLKVYGSSDNITNKYRANRLCLPGKSKAQSYIEQAEAVQKYGIHEARKIFEDIKPTFDGTITDVVSGSVLQFKDASMFDLNAKEADGKTTKYLVAGVSAKIHFNTGNLAGYEFDIHKYDHATRTITLKKLTDDRGDVFPSSNSTAFQFSVGDKYKILDVTLPERYQQEAEQKLQEQGNEYYRQNSQPKVKYGLSVAKSYLKKLFGTDAQVSLFSPGDYINVKDESIGVDKAVRIQSIGRNLLDVYDYTLTLSDVAENNITTRVISELVEIDKITTTHQLKDPTRAKANWRSSREVMNMVFDPDGDYYTDKIKPNSIDTLALSVGAKSMQFALQNVVFEPNFQGLKNNIRVSSGTLTHYTIEEQPRMWVIAQVRTDLPEDESAYYIFARCNKVNNVATIVFSKTPIKVEEHSNAYHFWIGVVNSVDPTLQARSIALSYGYSMINGRFITTGRIVSQDGSTYFDLDSGEIGGRIVFGNNEPLEEKIRELEQTSRSQRQHIRYSPYPNGREYGEPSGTPRMYTIPQDSSYMGILISYDDVASSNPDDYTWLLFKGRDGLPGRDGEDGVGIKGDDGVGVESVRPQYQVLSRPDASTAVESRWADDYPRWVEGRYLAVRMRVQYTSGSVRYSTPYISNEWEALSEVRELDHIKRAIKGKTMVEGGLMITRMVGVASNDEYIKDPSDRGKRSVTAYINGDSNYIATDSYAVDRASVARHIAFAAGVTGFGTSSERRTVEIDHLGNVRFGSFAIERDESGESVAYFLNPKTPAYNTPLLRVGGGQLPLQDLISSSGHTDSTYIRRGTSRTINMSMGIQSVTQLSEEMQAQGWIAIRDGATLEIKGDLHLQVTISDYFGTCADGSDARDCLTPKVIVSADMVIGQTTVHVMNKIYDYDGSRVYENKTYSLNRKLIGLPSSNSETPKLIVKAQIYRFKPANQSDANLNLQVIATVTNTSNSYGGVDIKTYTTNDVKQSVLSSNGLSFFWGRNRFLYVSNRPNDPVLSVRGKTDIYGALAHGVVEANVGNAAYRCVRYGGCYASSDGTAPYVGAPRLGTAEVSHNVGHTNYCVSIVPLGEARVSFSVSATQDRSFKVHFWNEQGTLVRVPFMYTILGTNYSE